MVMSYGRMMRESKARVNQSADFADRLPYCGNKNTEYFPEY
jgi:hypothetical protein